MNEIRFDTISHSWLASDTENDQPLNPQPIIEAFTPHDIYYDARVPFGAIYEATQSDTIHITADFAESLTLTHAAPDVFVAFERNVRAVSVTTEVENGDDVLLVNLQNGALIRLVQSGADGLDVQVRVVDADDIPTIATSGTAMVAEDAVAGTPTGLLLLPDSPVSGGAFTPTLAQFQVLAGTRGSAISDLFEVIHNGSDYILAVRAGALFDFVDMAQLDVRVVVSDDLGAQSTPLAVQVLQVVYDVFGTDAADTYRPDVADIEVHYHGLGGDDVIFGNSKNEHFYGGEGNDVYLSGNGADTFYYLFTNEGNDRIAGFGGNDVIDISVLLDGYIDGVSTLSNFVTSAGTGNNGDAVLSIDANGDGSGADVTIELTNVVDSATLIDDYVAGGNLILV